MQSKLSLATRRWFPSVVFALVVVVVGYFAMALAQAHNDVGFESTSLKDLTAAHARDPENANIMFELAHQLQKDGQKEPAYQLTRKLVEKEPKNLVYWQALARCASDAGHAVDALGAYQKGCEIDPKWAVGYLKQGEILAAAGLTTQAMAEYDQGAKLDPKAEVNLEPWAHCLMLKGRYQEAWDLLRAGTRKIMLSDNCYRYMTEAALRTRTHIDETDLILDHRISATPLYPLGKFRALKIELVLADKPDAETLGAMETVALQATSEKYLHPECFAILGKIRRLRGNLSGAEAALLTGAKIKDEDISGCLEELITVYQKMGKPDKAKQIQDRLWKVTGESAELAARRQDVQHNPHDTAALLALAKSLEEAGKYGEAAETYNAVLQIDPQNPTATAQREPIRQKALLALERVGVELAKPVAP